jgi:hypothetical protein
MRRRMRRLRVGLRVSGEAVSGVGVCGVGSRGVGCGGEMTTYLRVGNCQRRSHLAVLAALLVLLAACGSTNKGATVETSLNTEIAQGRILEYFAQTLAALPPQASLSLNHPTPGPGGEFSLAYTVPCDDNDQTNTGPVNLQLRLWMHGIPKGQGDAYFEMISKEFAARGWSPKPGTAGPSRIVRGYTKDGYAVIAQLNAEGDINLAGSTPCFPKANDQSSVPPPTTVAHPAG